MRESFMEPSKQDLAWVIKRLAQAQSNRLDGLRLKAALQSLNAQAQPPQLLAQLCQGVGMHPPQWLKAPDPVLLPCVAFVADMGWVMVTEQMPQGTWRAQSRSGDHVIATEHLEGVCAALQTGTKSIGMGWQALFGKVEGGDSFVSNVYNVLRMYRRDIVEACIASLFIGLLALVTSLFSMQVYDRVIPTRGSYTLIILASGVLLAIVLEFAMKHARAKLMDPVIVGMD
ncbi:MAG: type I secretion system permease/ATPase, partial [Burkholderiaceae bacterium]|nr:type I secretion system permease/ATPase [Burkholderiaceae bacterium]